MALGAQTPFSWEALKARAVTLAAAPYAPPSAAAAALVADIDYLAHQEIRQPPERGLWANGSAEAAVTFFHLGRLFPHRVRMNALEGDVAREVVYDPAAFEHPPGNPAGRMPRDAGFAGFRIHDPHAVADPPAASDWIAFLGASYFRMRGDLGQYGLSARGVAVDTALPEPQPREEFPGFREFWIRPLRGDRTEIFALLDGPSVAGAFRFQVARTPAMTMEVDCELNLRRDLGRFGVAPLTSMFWYGKINRFTGDDWRPAVHDSEGLAILNGRGERLWRPLSNPTRLTVSSFADESPRGFGLIQRERAFEAYLDGVARHERRPSLWVEPLGDWGRGAVQLLEIPTRVEYEDNIGAFWVPEAPARAGDRHVFRYRLHWNNAGSVEHELAWVSGTRMSRVRHDPDGALTRQIVIDFEGDTLASLEPEAAELDLVLSHGARSFGHGVERRPEAGTRTWRVFVAVAQRGVEPAEARLTLRRNGRALTETWLAQLHPVDPRPI